MSFRNVVHAELRTSARLRNLPVVAAALVAFASCASHAPAPPAPPTPSSARPTAKSPATTAPPSSQPSDTGPIGTAHPVVVEAASPDGRWVVICQARTDTNQDGAVRVTLGPRGELGGDLLMRYFVIGSGAGEPIEDFAGADPTGRWVALVRNGSIGVVDTRSQRVLDLSARAIDARPDAAPYRPHRALAFGANGAELAYVRRDAGRSVAVVYDLETGVERVVDPGGGEIWRLELTSAGLVLRVVVDDTNKNGRLDFPIPLALSSRRPCHGPIPDFSAFSVDVDQSRFLIASLNGVPAQRPLNGYISAFGRGVLRRESDGRLLLERDGSTSELAPARCGARVLHADPTRDVVLIACNAERGRASVRLVAPGTNLDLGIALEPHGYDSPTTATPRLVALEPGADSTLVDLDRREVLRLKPGDIAIATYANSALIRRNDALVVFDAETRAEIPLSGKLADLGDVLFSLPAVLVSPLVVDLERKTLLGRARPSSRPVWLTKNGRLLRATRSASASDLATGPLTWELPIP